MNVTILSLIAQDQRQLSVVPLSDSLKKTGWTSESSLAKFYDKKIVEDTLDNTFFVIPQWTTRWNA